MNRRLQWINLFGILALAVLCAAQWRVNRLLNLEINRMEQARMEQASKFEILTKTSLGQTNDIESLRAHLIRLTEELKETGDRLAASELQTRHATLERDQLKSAVTNWAAAIAGRDERLKQDAARLSQLAEQRNEAVNSFNELAERHNKLVLSWNSLQAKLEEQSKTNAGTNR
jgi:chromosome segregation ATPase